MNTGTSRYVKNPNLSGMSIDQLFHLGLNTNDDLKNMFGDVKFVCLGGSSTRMLKVAEFMQDELNSKGLCNGAVTSLSRTDRYVMYKAGPVLSVNHGIGIPSISIILNELIKLLHYAGAKDVVFFRIGTSGGLGAEPGTVVITRKAVNGLLEPAYEQIVLGKRVSYPSELDSQLASELLSCSKDSQNFSVIFGDTMCTSDFYEGQARLDGAFCDYQEEHKMAYLQHVHKAGVCNIEMESACFAALCKRANIAAGVVCVTLVNRLEGDQVLLNEKEHEDFQMRPMRVIITYIIKQLSKNSPK